MKVNIRVDTRVDEQEDIIGLVKYLFVNFVKEDAVNQTKLNSDNGKDRKYFCNNPVCKREISKKEVAFCLHVDNKDRFGGKVFCRVCQEGR